MERNGCVSLIGGSRLGAWVGRHRAVLIAAGKPSAAIHLHCPARCWAREGAGAAQPGSALRVQGVH